MQNEWRDFNGGAWENEVNVRGHHSTLAGCT